MTGQDHRTLRESLGAYALGLLEDSEDVLLRGHLADCPACRAELAELVPVVALLASVDPDTVSRLTAALPDRDPRGDPGAAGPGLPDAAPKVAVPAEGVEQVVLWARQPGVDASATAVSQQWGVEISLVAAGLRSGTDYEVIVLTATGHRVGAGRFVGTGTTPARPTLTCSVARGEAVGFVVLDDRGAVVVYGQL